MDVLKLLDQIPPCLCRLLARKKHGTQGLSHSEIAEASGLARSTVVDLSQKTSWEGVKVGVAVKFAQACGVNHMNSRRQLEYLKKSKLAHAKNAGQHQKRMYHSIFVKLG